MYTPGSMVLVPLLNVTAPLDWSRLGLMPLAVLGTGKAASGSGTDFTPVTGLVLKVLLLLWTPPTTWMLAAVICEPPAAETAEAYVESTCTMPGILMTELLASVSAPEALALRT